ncbi:lethal giant larvae like, C-terminal-domain-containing protein [Coniella lustricola]|uniref:Lethal giant larvae like, C-terminal-domain-containing protein n=1 Tax=Coniella lustricola TaxID=2025994 RepID=A0A2T2ZT71_9PEZI|nr:lethal giant larvae like, C-terminal-domain-containing protein [Coniella lustricola]
MNTRAHISCPSCLAYDPVQSLLAVGTNESRFSKGQVYVFGRDRIQKFFVPPRPTSFKSLHFCANRLVSLDTKGELTIWDLDTAKRVAGGACGSAIATMVTDPMLDWAFAGQSNGEVTAFDLDRGRISPFRIPNFWKSKDPKATMVTLVSLQMHPRDVGKMLIGYSHGVVVYSFKQSQPTKFFEYVLQPGAPGGNAENVETVRRPRITHALWHPTGTFILTAHEDGSLVFWDPKDGRIVMARSLYETKVDQVVRPAPTPRAIQPFVKIAWCCKENPDDTALLVAGGQAADERQKGLTFLELGPTPNYATSTWQILEEHLKGKRQSVLPTPPGTDVTGFALVPRYSPHFAGAQDPIAVLATLSSGELITMSFPSGFPISPTNQLHPSLSFVHPFVVKVVLSTLDRGRWLGMVEKRNKGEDLIKGGAEAGKPRRRFEGRNIIQVAHADSTIRLWDLGHADDIENTAQLQVDMARAVGRLEDVDVTAMHLAPHTGEFAAGTRMGEVVIWRWGGNPRAGHDEAHELDPNPGKLTDITSRAEPSLVEGLQPYVLYEMAKGPISAIAVSDIGFVAVGSEAGFFSIIDLRGPSIIYQVALADLAKKDKRTSFLKGHSKSPAAIDYAVKVDFGVLTLDDDSYSSIACFVGTDQGKLATFKILPAGTGYNVELAGITSLSDRVVAICPIVAETGQTAAATPEIVGGLRNGQHINGVVVAVTQTEIRVFKPATSKGASKSFDDVLCNAAAVADCEINGFALVATFGDGSVRAFSLPGLKEISRAPLPMLDASRNTLNIVACTGDVIGWAGPSELVVVPVWGTGKGRDNLNNDDKLVNPEAVVPPRPTISNVQWLSGTQYVSPTDLDLLIGGPDRPASKRMMDATAAEERAARTGGAGGPSSSATGTGAQESWGDYLTRQINERTEKLNIMGDNVESLEEQSSGWANDVSKFVGKQKRSMVLGGLKSKFF